MTTLPTLRPYALSDNLAAASGAVFLTGTQALVRLPLMQKRLDEAAGLNTAGFVSGYRGSPLGMVDQQMWKAKKFLGAASVQFMPAINEDLAATACLGTQRVALDPQRTVDGVFALWYGKGPGVDRSGDALKHGHVYGSSAQGGVLVVAGDDHGCVSSSMPHQSDLAMQAWSMPVLHPANVAEYLEFGLYGWALSRFSGAWVGFKALSEVVESGMTVDLDAMPVGFGLPVDHPVPPAIGSLHVRSVDLPSLGLEERLAAKLDAVRAFARINSVDKHIVASPAATLGIVTVGKAHFDFMEVLRRLDLDPNALAAAGVRVYKVGLVFPLEPTRMLDFARGLEEILVIEEKGPMPSARSKRRWPDRERMTLSLETPAMPAHPVASTASATDTSDRARSVERLVAGMPTSDGAGVKLTRVLTQPLQRRLDPFLMLDAFGSDSAEDYIAGFPDHPHRGFETVTYMIAGRMRHRDSAGHEGLLENGGFGALPRPSAARTRASVTRLGALTTKRKRGGTWAAQRAYSLALSGR